MYVIGAHLQARLKKGYPDIRFYLLGVAEDGKKYAKNTHHGISLAKKKGGTFTYTANRSNSEGSKQKSDDPYNTTTDMDYIITAQH